MDATLDHTRKVLITSAVDKVRAGIAYASLHSPDLSVNVTLDIDEALALLSVRPVQVAALFASTLSRLRLEANGNVPQWNDVLDTGSDGSEPPDAQAADADRIAFPENILPAYGFPPVHIGQGE